MKLKVAGAQLAFKIRESADIPSNVKKISQAIDFAETEKADILLTPEGSVTGYSVDFDKKVASDAVSAIVNKARSAGVGLALGTDYFDTDTQQYYNQLRFYDKQGKFIGAHNKILRTVRESAIYGTGPIKVFHFKSIVVGGLLCNDMWANPEVTPVPDPHLSHQLSALGARIIFLAVNGGRDASEHSQEVVRWYHESNMRMRAKAGKLWIIVVDDAEPVDLKCSCPGGVINKDGDWTYRARDKGEDLFTYDIDIGD